MPEPTPDVRALLRELVESFEQLELLLLLRREVRDWTAAEAAARIGSDAEAIADALQALAQRGLLAARPPPGEPAWRWAPRDGRRADDVAAIERAHVEQRLEVMKWMNENAIARVRDAAARAFADAFLLRKERKDG